MSDDSPPRKVVVFDISPRDLELLANFGIISNHDPSWTLEKRKTTGLRNLIVACGIQANGEMSEILHHATNNIQNAEQYFEDLASRVKAILTESPAAIAINLMPLIVCKTRMDKILKGLFQAADFCQPCEYLILSRNIDGVEDSAGFEGLKRRRDIRGGITLLDIRGYGARHTAEGRTSFKIARQIFRDVLACDKESIYLALVFETNSFIGHFALPHSHARTHYSLNDFVDRDDVWEYLIDFFLREIGEAENVLIVGIGMEAAVISRIGFRLHFLLGDKCLFEIEPFTDSKEAFVGWSSRFQTAIIVTDIVNSGGTLQPAVELLQSQNHPSRPLKILSIAAMLNSPTAILGVPLTASLRIRRNFYSSQPDECPLCQLDQPIVRVEKVEDFEKVPRTQLTPFDFWELVFDANALQESKTDNQGREFVFRIETSQLMRRYGNWLRNLIRIRFREIWPNLKPDVICTVDEKGGEQFAALVGSAIDVSTIVKIPREELNRAAPRGRLERPKVQAGSKVLLVDDGMNYGKTMKQLITYNNACRGSLIGVIVLDSRLRSDELSAIKRLMGNNEVLALYSWPAKSFRQ
jgi:adenine/guanine phosphoribosyltransferase-like PRPP-binding protein